MAILRCKMCGGDLEITAGVSSCTCEFCGTVQTIPTVKEEALQTLFNRANVLRMKSEFDKASEIYEKILQKSETEAEAYWGLILCKYGIEYVEDPNTFKRIPTCHRASYDAVTSDEDYKNAIKYADAIQREIYEAEAKTIDEVQKGIIALAQKEDPYDVFICYKETDENGNRTQDSVIANDIYYQLTQEGFKVFYAAITLEDKLGSEYEPHIFSALNTAKVMLSLGTKPEYFNAVWVKNEWSRFLKIMKKDRSKMLIPCYRDMDAYELPEEFSHLQAQDMSKIGFITDLIRGIKKVIVKESSVPAAQEPVVVQQAVNGTTSLAQVKRGNMALEDQDWAKADAFFEEALNIDPECAEAYLGKLLVKEKKTDFSAWVTSITAQYNSFSSERLEACPAEEEHISRIVQDYEILGYLNENTIRKEYIFDRDYSSTLSSREQKKAEILYKLSSDRLLTRTKQYAKNEFKKLVEDSLSEINSVMESSIVQAQNEDKEKIGQIKEAYQEKVSAADKRVQELRTKAEEQRESDYQEAVSVMKTAEKISDFENARMLLRAVGDYKECTSLAKECEREIKRLKEEAEEERKKERERHQEESKKEKMKRKTTIAVATFVLLDCVIFVYLLINVIIPNIRISQAYKSAIKMMDEGDYYKAYEIFLKLDGYKDSKERASEISLNHYEEMLLTIAVGDTITFGMFEQDNNSDNGKEQIEWIVLAKDDSTIFVVSKYALDCQVYKNIRGGVRWENSELRTWMNDDFFNSAFTSQEQSMILTMDVSAEPNPQYNSDPGNSTNDRIFALCIREVEQYLNWSEAKLCIPTAYAKAQEVYVDGNGYCQWWLRNPGKSLERSVTMNCDGTVNYSGDYTQYTAGVRPAMWINLLPY